jgi:hypothetical protein
MANSLVTANVGQRKFVTATNASGQFSFRFPGITPSQIDLFVGNTGSHFSYSTSPIGNVKLQAQ